MSTFQIHFKLHESYADQNRMLTAPPYEVTETGWGEFEIVIKIYFHDPNERPVSCSSIVCAILLTFIITWSSHLVKEVSEDLALKNLILWNFAIWQK